MIAIDTSSLVAYFGGSEAEDVQAVDDALSAGVGVMIPAVLAEMLSDPSLPAKIQGYLQSIPLLEITDGYWQRVGQLRRMILAKNKKARLADALIAQSCLDYRIPLISRDADFRNFAAVAPLRLIPRP